MSFGKTFSRLLQWLGLRSRPATAVSQSVGEGVDFGQPTMIDPVAADLSPDDLEHLPIILDRLASLAIDQLNLLADEACDRGDLVAAAKLAADGGFTITVRGRATELAQSGLREELASAGVAGMECLFLSPIEEIHDALAGVGDCRLAKALISHASTSLPCSALVPLVPAIMATLDRTLDYLIEHQVRRASFFAIVSADDEPSSWAVSTEDLISVAARLSSSASSAVEFDWYPPQRFDRTQSLAQQIRRGPRSRWNSIRVQCDGRVFPPVGPWQATGNLLPSDAFVPTIKLAAGRGKCATCPNSPCCASGCIRNPATWAQS